MASKAELIQQANRLRRDRDRLRRMDGVALFNATVLLARDNLHRAGVSDEDIHELLPDGLMEHSRCRLQPLADHVVLRPAAVADVTPGGIVKPDSAKEVPMQGEVLAVGPGRVEPGVGTIVPAVKVGDTVLFGRYAGVEVQLDGEDVRIMREEDILGILAPETA